MNKIYILHIQWNLGLRLTRLMSVLQYEHCIFKNCNSVLRVLSREMSMIQAKARAVPRLA